MPEKCCLLLTTWMIYWNELAMVEETIGFVMKLSFPRSTTWLQLLIIQCYCYLLLRTAVLPGSCGTFLPYDLVGFWLSIIIYNSLTMYLKMSFWLVIYCNWWILLKFHIENVPRQLPYFLLCITLQPILTRAQFYLKILTFKN